MSAAHQHFNRIYYVVQTWLGHDLELQLLVLLTCAIVFNLLMI